MSKIVPATGDAAKPVWLACRATPGCEGKYAKLSWRKKLMDGMVERGETFRYRCTTCNKVFHITR